MRIGVSNPPRWLTSPDWAVPAVVLTGIWTIGGGAIIYLAGLQNIPPHLYEAAELDGAGALARFRHITIPMLSPTLFFVLITTLIGAFQVFDVAFVLGGSRGGGGNLLFYLLNLWNEGFRNGRYGYASALAVVFVAVRGGRRHRRDAALGAIRLLRRRRPGRARDERRPGAPRGPPPWQAILTGPTGSARQRARPAPVGDRLRDRHPADRLDGDHRPQAGQRAGVPHSGRVVPDPLLPVRQLRAGAHARRPAVRAVHREHADHLRGQRRRDRALVCIRWLRVRPTAVPWA